MLIKLKKLLQKIRRKINGIIVNKIANTPLQFKVYRSYWHYRLSISNFKLNKWNGSNECFITQVPNHGAGIGHQLANWNAGLHYSKFFNFKFAHSPFSNDRWERFLGFGENEVHASTLIKNPDFKKVYLPRFDCEKPEDIELISNIVNSYSHQKVLFLLEQDQPYTRQCDTAMQLASKFYEAFARKEDKLIYSKNDFNIAIHIRRGDIVTMKESNISNGSERWLNNNYYVTVLKQVLETIKVNKKINIYLFSQGVMNDYLEFTDFKNINFCLDVNAYDSFLHLVNADLLITSKSSFSYKPALISKGIKICPNTFWHHYPDTPDFVLATDQGEFKKDFLKVFNVNE